MKILVIELSNLGDAILTFPALGAVWAAYPDAEYHLLAGPRTIDLFSGDPRIDRVWVWRKEDSLLRHLTLIGKLWRERYDWVIDFRHSLIPLFLGARRRTPLLRRPIDGTIHRAEVHRALVEALGVPAASGPTPPLDSSAKGGRPLGPISPPVGGEMKAGGGAIPLATGPEAESRVEEWLKTADGGNARVVVIAPGARSHLKRWPAERFAAVADRLIAEEKVRIVLVGDSEERFITEAVRKKMGHPALDLSGRTTIRELAALLAQADLVITNDSACLHAAEAMERPTVAIFGPTDERKYGPQLPGSAVVRRHLICAPCEQALCPYRHECMNELEVEEVYEAVVRVLRG